MSVKDCLKIFAITSIAGIPASIVFEMTDHTGIASITLIVLIALLLIPFGYIKIRRIKKKDVV